MIVIYHSKNRVVEVKDSNNQNLSFNFKSSVAENMNNLARQFPDMKIVWCNFIFKNDLNITKIDSFFHHHKMMMSYRPSNSNFLGENLGFFDESLFVNVNKNVTFPTWQMSSAVGVIHSSILNLVINKIPFDHNFDYYLNSFAKLAMPMGLFCYSEPKLLKTITFQQNNIASSYLLFKFIKQHYRIRWLFIFLLNLFLYKRTFPIFPFCASFIFKKRNNNEINFNSLEIQSTRRLISKKTLDVIIPTIGRKSYLHNVLKDFSKQTFLPNKIIIVEQNPQKSSISELDFIKNESWPFQIEHYFIHRPGACNARNLALSKTESEWVFLADDDNRFSSNLLEDVFKCIIKYGSPIVTPFYPKENESKTCFHAIQSSFFSGGNSFVKREFLEKVSFNISLEFGYGEDNDFGMQLRNLGCDVIYLPDPTILHLHAPIGGFRTKTEHIWNNEIVQPKPSPTVMLSIILHKTKQQLLSYKTILFFKYYRLQKIKNPIKYYFNFQKQWNSSLYWANILNEKK